MFYDTSLWTEKTRAKKKILPKYEALEADD